MTLVPRTKPSHNEPLFAIYKKSALAAIEKTIASGENQIIAAYKFCKVNYVDLTDTQKLKNLNTMEDYSEFIRKENCDKF